jgi:hypothetical protein
MGGGGAGMVKQAGEFLNQVLSDLVNVRDLKINRVTQSIVISGPTTYGPFPLEADYLRTYDLFFYLPGSGSPGEPQKLELVTMEVFDSENKASSNANYPYEFATDTSTQAQTWAGTPQQSAMTSAGQLFVYPASVGTLTLTHRYMIDQPDIVTPETSGVVPWFPHQLYLILATASLMCDYNRDDQAEKLEARAERLLKPYLIMEGDEQKAPHALRLDPRKFTNRRGVKPTKTDPW